MTERFFRSLSIRHKLVLLMMVTACTVLALSAVSILYVEARSEREDLLAEVTALAEVVAAGSRAALVFDDREAATATLGALRTQPLITAAYLLDERGTVFARVLKDGHAHGAWAVGAPCSETEMSLRQADHRFRGSCLCLSAPVLLDGGQVGTLFLNADLKSLQVKLAGYAGAVGTVFLLSAVLALFLASFLQIFIARPIERLISVMGQVSENNDYSLRLTPRGKDEVGRLIRVFNRMLERVRDHEQRLEERVRQRTAALEAEVAERRRAEDSLRMLKKGMETTQVGITITDLEGRIIYSNEAEARMHGYDGADLLGRHANLFGPPGQRSPVDLAQMRTWQRESRNVRRDGSSFPVQLTSDLVTDGEGEPLAVVTVCEDITERRERERILRESEEKFKNICAAAHDAIVMTDADDRITVWNRAAEAIFGYAEEEVAGRPLHSLLAPSPSRPRFEAGFARFRESGAGEAVGRTVELTALRRDGSAFPLELSLSAIRIGGAWNAIGVARDITERKGREEELRASLEEKEVLLKEVHHRVKNNLQIISSLLSLQAKKVTEAGTRAALASARHRIHSMAAIHERLYRSGELARVDFSEYLGELARELFRFNNINPQQVRLAMEVGEVRLPLDRAIPCAMIINELLSNALKYAFPEGRTGTVRLRLREDLLAVEDDGVGLGEGFEPEGTGTLGLQLVFGLARQVGGSVRIDGGDGTRVEVALPGGTGEGRGA